MYYNIPFIPFKEFTWNFACWYLKTRAQACVAWCRKMTGVLKWLIKWRTKIPIVNKMAKF